MRYLVTSAPVSVKTLLDSFDLTGTLNTLSKALPFNQDIQALEARLQTIVSASETLAQQLGDFRITPRKGTIQTFDGRMTPNLKAVF